MKRDAREGRIYTSASSQVSFAFVLLSPRLVLFTDQLSLLNDYSRSTFIQPRTGMKGYTYKDSITPLHLDQLLDSIQRAFKSSPLS